jgi:hypothetical protein
MARYQFEPMPGHALDVSKAKAIVTNLGARHIRIAYPIVGNGRATNKPRTIVFSGTADLARRAALSYGLAHVEITDISSAEKVQC